MLKSDPIHTTDSLCFCRTYLNCRLARWTLCRGVFQTAQKEIHFSQAQPWRGRPDLRWDELPPEVELVLHLSRPVQPPLPQRLGWNEGALVYVPVIYDHHYIELVGTYEEYLTKFSSKSRWCIRRNLRDLQRRIDGPDWREYSRPEQMEEFCKAAQEVSAKTYQERIAHCGFPKTREYLEYVKGEAANDGYRGYVLYHGERPIAFESILRRGSAGVGQFTGFDPAYRDVAPGACLMQLVIAHLLGTKTYKVLDFGPQEFDYKRSLCTHSTRCANIYCFRPSARSLAYTCLHHWVEGVSRFATSCFGIFGVRREMFKRIHRAV